MLKSPRQVKNLHIGSVANGGEDYKIIAVKYYL